MNNMTALILALLIVVFLGVDAMANEAAGMTFLARRGIVLLEYLAFWR